MRISDWSSDVCSSDLADAADRGRRGLHGHRLPAARIPAQGPGRLVLLRRHLAADRGGGGHGLHFPDPGPPDVAPVREPAQEGEPQGWCPGALTRPAAPRNIRPGPMAGTRSEEHTSELQSLMRISYAVFCLKKK